MVVVKEEEEEENPDDSNGWNASMSLSTLDSSVGHHHRQNNHAASTSSALDTLLASSTSTLAAVHQQVSQGQSYTGDSSFASFDEQMRIARKRELERRQSESLLKLGGSSSRSLRDLIKAFER